MDEDVDELLDEIEGFLESLYYKEFSFKNFGDLFWIGCGMNQLIFIKGDFDRIIFNGDFVDYKTGIIDYLLSGLNIEEKREEFLKC